MFKRLILSVSLLVLTSACCAIDGNFVVLMPDPDGGVGRVTITNPRGSTLLSQARQATKIAGPDQAPATPVKMSMAEIQRLFAQALAAQPSAPVKYRLYFETGSTVLTPASRTLLPRIVRTIKARQSVDTSIVGHADTAGTKAYNLQLSTRRAAAVADLLKSRGVDPGIFEITSHGEGNLLIKTGDNVSEPKNRRVEVTVR